MDPAAPQDERRRDRIYGRRKGHALRARQARLVDTLLPRLRLDLDAPAPAPAGLFAPPVREVWLEIGFGGGEHLAWQAAHHPDTGFIGAEPFVNGIAKLLAEVEARDLHNVRIHDGDARELVAWLPAASIARCFILYPDPWPKTRHRKRRIVSAKTLAELARIMIAGGELRIATDIGDYADWILRRILAGPDFTWLAGQAEDWRVRPDDWPATRYEAKAVREGRRPIYLRFRRNAGSAPRP